jgi:hypothetical protein
MTTTRPWPIDGRSIEHLDLDERIVRRRARVVAALLAEAMSEDLSTPSPRLVLAFKGWPHGEM